MSEVTLEQALSNISSSSQKTRADGLKDLKHVLIKNKNSKKLQSLGEKGYHGIFDALFQLLAVEKLGYTRAKTPGTKRTALARIEACASAVRTTVEVIGQRIRAKNLFTVIDHIVDSLYNSDTEWWQHISNAYLKALRILLEYPPHVEHLSREKWQKICDFCLSSLTDLGSDGDIQGSSGLTPLQGLSLDSASRASSVEPSSARRKRSATGQYGARIELEISVQLLCSSPIAPLVDEGVKMLGPLLDYLLAVHSPSSASPYILGAFNTVLSKTLISNMSVSQMTLINILPFLRRLMIPKSSALREEMMVTLELARAVLPYVKDVEFTRILDDTLPSLVDHLQHEYLKLSDREVLHLDDLTFTSPNISVPMGIPGMGPRLGVTRAEETWTLIRAIATFSAMLEGKATSPAPQADEDESGAERPLKKMFKLTRVNGLLRDSHAAIGPEKVFALQLVPFLIGNVPSEDLQSLLTRLNANIMDDHDETQSWTMVAIANIAGHKDASSPLLKPLWSQTWSLATRSISSPHTSRAACSLIAAMIHHNLQDEATIFSAVNIMLSAIEMNGPSGLTDASLLMWTCLLRKSAVSQPVRNKQISTQICAWLRSAWVYDAMTDKVHASHLTTFARPREMINLLLACTNRHIDSPSNQLHGAVSRISRAWFQLQLDSDLLRYLFDAEDPEPNLPHTSYPDQVDLEDLGKSRPNDGIVLELLHTKTIQLSRFWESLLTEEARLVTDEVIHMLTSLCVISSFFVRLVAPSSSECHHELQQVTDSLWFGLCSFFEKQDTKYFMASLDILAPLILPLKVPFPDNVIVDASLFLSLRDCGAKIKPFLKSLLRNNLDTGPIASQAEGAEIDMMVDGPWHSDSASDSDLGLLREDYPLLIYPSLKMTARATVIQWLVLLEMTEDNSLTITGSLVDFLTSLNGTDILIWRPVFLNFFDTSPSIARTDACRLVEYFADNCLMVWSIQRTEAAPSVCIHLVTVILPLLSLDDSDDLEKAAHDLLDWFSQSLVKKGQGTPRTLARITTLYHGIMALPGTPCDNGLRRSYQQSLIEVLLQSDLKVKYHLSKLLPSAFDRIPPDTHDAFFDGIFEGFPIYSDWIEGTSVRLFVLGELASHCGSVLRRSVYRIFETAGQVPESSRYAKRCLETASRALGLRGVKDLFRIFASQLLYTWLEPQVGQARQSLASVPFTIFDYFTLKDLLLEVQDEIVGQIMLRGQDDEMAEISSILETPFTGLLTASFAKAEAYVVANSISVPPSQLSQQTGGEKKIKALLGKTQFSELLIYSLPSIIATLVQRVDEPAIESLKKIPNSDAIATWKAIDLKSHSETSIPTGQQPCFRSKYLYDELGYICKRANIQVTQLWNSSLFCYVARSLMDTVQPALGPLQACAVLRKLKMLICISGSAVFEGYGSPMILHFLRPFLMDQCCCDDALGIFWYIYENRKTGSFFEPSFEIGLAISSLVSLRTFIYPSQNASQRHACSESLILRLRDFSKWFSQHLGTFSEYICGPDGQAMSFFRKLILLTKNSEGWGRSHMETAGGKLLLLLLEDQASPSPVLVDPAKEQLFNLLSKDFQREVQPKWDILGEDANAIAHALNAWRCCPTSGATTPYKLWVARALGRAYAASGELNQSLLREQKTYPHEHNHDHPSLTSKIAVVKVLCDTLMSSVPEHVGLAERTLQMIVQRLGNNSASIECKKALSEILHRSFIWAPYLCPTAALTKAELEQFNHEIRWNASSMASEWARETSILLCLTNPIDMIVGCLPKILHALPYLAEILLPYVMHDVLLSEFDGKQTSRFRLSAVFNQAFRNASDTTVPHIKLMIRCLLYLRRQVYPKESNADDRDFWLDVDYQLAASAAWHCEMYKTALLFIEVHFSHLATASRRSTAGIASAIPAELLARIYSSIDDPDLNHGLEEEVAPEAILRALSSSGSSVQKLSFQTASYDADIRLLQKPAGVTQLQLVKALNETNFQGLANDLLSASNRAPDEEAMLSTALYLQQWDIPVPSTKTAPTTNVFKVLKCLNTQNDEKLVYRTIDDSLLAVTNQLTSTHSLLGLKECMRALASLSEIDEIISSDPGTIRDDWSHMKARNHWLKFESFADIKELLFCREAIFSSLACSSSPNNLVKVDSRTSRELQFRTIQESLRISRDHDELQVAMKSAVFLIKLAPICREQGLSVNIAAQFELAQVLWDQGEMSRSIRLLRNLASENLRSQTVEVNLSRLLSTLGQRIAEARLQDPTEIRNDYLAPAADDLVNNLSLRQADGGKVFHDFAVFCDRQVSNQDTVEDLRRLEMIRNRKEQELLELESMLVKAPDSKKREFKSHRDKAKAWFELDNSEWRMQKENHDSLMISAIVNYLRSLADCDTYKNDVLRFCALWLDNADNDDINLEVADVIDSVPSRRFAPLVNQLFSRLSDDDNEFQGILHDLLFRTCIDHPYHGMYQVFMSSKSMTGGDDSSMHRYRAANILADRLKADRDMGTRWVSIHNANVVYVRFAMERVDDRVRSGTKLPLAKSQTGSRLATEIPSRKLPPPTMKIELRDDCDYSKVPVVTSYLPEYAIASGISAPKIVTAIASDGKRYKQLFKGGNDDLRQDLIMEQVFEQVSGLLKEHRETRQRELGIRTYNVVPITTNTGIIEFVQNTIPLNDYLLPAHASHFPRDMSFKAARQIIFDAQLKSSTERLKAYKRVTSSFHPVLRFFFMERFLDPNDWFSKRLAYTRSTAAISILGHILGLGDRHGHNILLDEQTGEVIHIDLGVAFEQGRVLPIPEVVPFRLTRDLVDGMGITKTEGVFRRSCEFTLEALRRESYSIMTILDVLRYDPLYSWSLSPLRAKKMQDTQEAGSMNANGKRTNEPSEADRALTIVAKKLGKTLSVSATVNELIQQATDERNLSVLFCGWAAFA